MKPILKPILLGALLLAPVSAWAEDAALVIVESDYRRLPEAPGGNRSSQLADSLDAAGFDVTAVLDADSQGAWEAVAAFREAARDADRVFVLLSGHIVSTPRESYLLTRYAQNPNDLSVGSEAVALGPILDVAAAHQGQAVVMLAPSMDEIGGDGLTVGASVAPPQGVTLIDGPLDDLIRVTENVMLVPGRGPASALARPPSGVTVSGFLSDALPFLPAPGETGSAPPAPDMQAAFWQVAGTMGTVEAFEAYLEAYPGGRYANDARAAIARIEGNAESQAQATENALGLNRDARREVQRNLSLLGYDPRGIDGIFGPGSRAAIRAWQRDNGYEVSGYLTSPQLRDLGDAAQVRAAELEREAAARKAEEERRDRQYWEAIGRGEDEAGLRAYLERYPDGLYADIAEQRLADIEAAKRDQARAEERDVWDRVRNRDTVDAYQRYLERYPNGTFEAEARARIDELTGADDDATTAAQAEESSVAGNPVTRLLVETRLKLTGFDPGAVDGQFNDTTRRAIRRFQRAQGLEVTGYVTKATMVRLLAIN